MTQTVQYNIKQHSQNDILDDSFNLKFQHAKRKIGDQYSPLEKNYQKDMIQKFKKTQNTYKSKIIQLQENLKQKQKKNQELRQQNSRLNEQVNQLKNQQNEQQRIIDPNLAENSIIQQLKAQVAMKNLKIIESQKRNEQLLTKYNQSKKQLQQLEYQVRQMKKLQDQKTFNTQKENIQLKKTISDLEETRDSYKNQIKELTQNNEQNSANFQELAKKSSNHQREMQSIKKLLEQHKQLNQQLDKEISTKNWEILQAIEARSKSQNDCQNLKLELKKSSEIYTQYQDLKQRYSSKQIEDDRLERQRIFQQIRQLKNIIESLNQTINNHQNKIKEYKLHISYYQYPIKLTHKLKIIKLWFANKMFTNQDKSKFINHLEHYFDEQINQQFKPQLKKQSKKQLKK